MIRLLTIMIASIVNCYNVFRVLGVAEWPMGMRKSQMVE
jgi:hypothetical protein